MMEFRNNTSFLSFFVCLITVLFLSACGTFRKAQHITLDEITVSADKADYALYRGSATRVWDIINTNLALSFNMNEKTANGTAILTLHPYFYTTDTLVLDAKSMQIDSVSMINGPKVSYTYDGDSLTIRFAKKFYTTDTIQLLVKYKAMPYATSTGGSKAISDDRGLYFINTDHKTPGQPVQIWTQGESEANSHWVPTIDKPNERFTTEIALTVPDSFVTLSNGYLLSQEKRSNNLRTDTWMMNKPIQTYAVMFAIGNFSIVKDTWHNREVNYYVEPDYAPYARAMFNNTPEMMQHFSDITGMLYPWNKYSQVVVRDYVSGAMENTSASLFGEFMNEDSREIKDFDFEDVVSHELFHQWFGDYVTAESWSNLTLNESFADYGETLWRRYKYGKISADDHAIQGIWAYLYGVSKENDPSLVRFHYGSREDMFDRVSYQKGGAILRYMNALMGDSAFYKAMNLYLTKNALQPAEATQWRLAVEEVTGQDWNWFFNEWYYRGGHPVLNCTYNYDDAAKEVTVTVVQAQASEAYTLPVKVWAVYDNGRDVMDETITKKLQSFTYPYKNGMQPVIVIDAEHWIPGDVNNNLKPAQWLTVYRQSEDNIINKRIALSEVRKNLDDTASRSIYDIALTDREATARKLALQNLSKVKTDKWHSRWQPAVRSIAVGDKDTKTRAVAFQLLASWKVKMDKQDVQNALSDSSYSVSGAALNALNVIDKDTAYIVAEELGKGEIKGTLRSAVWTILADKGNPEDISFWERTSYNVYGTVKLDFSDKLSTYLQNVTNDSAFSRVLAIYERLIENEGIKSYRQAITNDLFLAARTYKVDVSTAKKNSQKETAQWRLDAIKQSIERIMKAENEEENLKKYRQSFKNIFESAKS